MMARNRTPFTKLGRPAKAKSGPAPMDSLSLPVPAKAFRSGGAVAKAHYDDARMDKGFSEMGYCSARDHAKRLQGK